MSTAQQATKKIYGTSICKTFHRNNGTCGVEGCEDMHEPITLGRKLKSYIVCSHDQKGTCTKGDECTFLHLGSLAASPAAPAPAAPAPAASAAPASAAPAPATPTPAEGKPSRKDDRPREKKHATITEVMDRALQFTRNEGCLYHTMPAASVKPALGEIMLYSSTCLEGSNTLFDRVKYGFTTLEGDLDPSVAEKTSQALQRANALHGEIALIYNAIAHTLAAQQ